MDRLRIRIPPLNYVCIVERCREKTSELLCVKCLVRLHARVSKEVTATTLAYEAEIRHRATLRGHLSC
jgi:hypothetical protein